MKNKSLFHVFTNGLLNENPTFRLLLGMCPTLAISTAASSGVGMGLATTFVLVFSNMVISMLRHIIPERVRIPGFIVVIATFVTIIDLVIKAFLPSMSDTLGIYIPLIVVNCIIFARAESYAFKNPVIPSAVDGLGMGLGFTCSLTLLSTHMQLFLLQKDYYLSDPIATIPHRSSPTPKTNVYGSLEAHQPPCPP